MTSLSALFDDEEIWQKVESHDEKAKARGVVVGRYIKEQIADGYAYYMIDRVVGGHGEGTGPAIAHLVHIPYIDGYTVPMIESMDLKVPLKYAKENIDRRDRVHALFNRKENELNFG